MTIPDARANTGVLPGYLSVQEAAQFAGMPIGERTLSVTEEANMLVLGLDRKDILTMTPESLEQMANGALSVSNVCVG